ncbi:iron chelate uptake ABC transporter family permease subunit [Seonamhaeicola sp. NFXS20]|uniref:iron chelate uptake ABC transporter family permease subunit n=1 Tax=Seonamhaeicola sp. NFXS20 TaxID=2816959 RepID=UPI003B9E28DD
MTAITKKMSILLLLTLGLIALFLFIGLPNNWDYALEKRSVKIVAIIVVSCAVATASVIFQTLTSNRILTPSIMGFEAVYFLFQTVIIFIYGDKTFRVINQENNFFLSILCMLLFAFVIFKLLFKKEKNNLYLLLLIGLVLGTLFQTVSSFLQLIIDPNEFLMLQGSLYASFNSINYDLLWYASGTLLLCFGVVFCFTNHLNVMLLGRDQSINLGVNYFKKTQLFLFLIAILVSVSTALVGPITFLGVLVTNLTYELFKTYKHQILIPACCMVSIVSILLAQYVVEEVFQYNSTISIIINFVGGIYFMYLLFKAKKL